MQDDRGMVYGLEERVPAGWIIRKLVVERSRGGTTHFASLTRFLQRGYGLDQATAWRIASGLDDRRGRGVALATGQRLRVTEFGSSTPYAVGDIEPAHVSEDGPVPVVRGGF